MKKQSNCTAEGIASWLFENTGLSFEQIAKFCNLPTSIIEMIADDELDEEITMYNPVMLGYTTLEDIKMCEKSKVQFLQKSHDFFSSSIGSKGKKNKNSSSKRRRDKPDAIAWLLEKYPEINDFHIIKLISTTRDTIDSIRNRNHWNINNITPKDPVELGLCGKNDFEQVLFKMRVALERNKRLKEISKDINQQTQINDLNLKLN